MHTALFIPAIPAQAPGASQALVCLEAEYLSWVQLQMQQCFPGHACKTASLTPGCDESRPEARRDTQAPWSRFYLIEVAGEAAGLCGLRMLSRQAAEVKRLYVRPGFRGMGLGSLAVERLLAEARGLGCARLVLDSAPFMRTAHRVYEAHGFEDCDAHEGTEVPRAWHRQWRFMNKDLRTPGA